MKAWPTTVLKHPANSPNVMQIGMCSSTNNKILKVSMKILMIISNQKVVSVDFKKIFLRMTKINIKNIRKYISQVFKFQRQIYLLEECNQNSTLMSVCRMILNWIKFHLLVKIKIKFKMVQIMHLKLVISIRVNNYKALMKNKKYK